MEGVLLKTRIIASPFTKMLIEDEFNLNVVPIKKSVKGFQSACQNAMR